MDVDTWVPMAPAVDVADEVQMVVVAMAVPVWGFGWVGMRGLCVEEQECNLHKPGKCSRSHGAGGVGACMAL
jgi:hypothetical protein